MGDDLLMSDPERIKRAVNEYTCNTLVLKASLDSSIYFLKIYVFRS
jgi:enolase